MPDIIYSALAKMVHNRLVGHPDSFQTVDQVGFWPGVGVKFATAVFENVFSKMLEKETELWVASVDLNNDDFFSWGLFAAPSRQHVPRSCINLLHDPP